MRRPRRGTGLGDATMMMLSRFVDEMGDAHKTGRHGWLTARGKGGDRGITIKMPSLGKDIPRCVDGSADGGA
jgi:hypothetical protein